MNSASKSVGTRFLEAMEGAQVASFDMFDTLVHRITHPKAVQHQVVMFAAKSASITPARAQELRDVAWEIVASANSSQGLDHEATISDWMRQWVWLISLDPNVSGLDVVQLAARLLEFELRLEGEVLRPNHDVLELLNSAKTAGLKVIVTSDMYLEKEHLKRLLNTLGIYVDDIFVSSETAKTKRSGRLFKHLSQVLDIPKGGLLHIGDNPDADVDGAEAADLDIKSVFYDLPSRSKRMRQKEFVWDQYVATNDAGELIRVAAEDTSEDVNNGFIGYGHDVYGPSISAFIKRIAEIAEEREIDKVYFMAREGFLLKMVYDTYLKSLGKEATAVPAGYLCVSRLTTLKVTSGSYGLREVALGTIHAGTSVRKALGSLVEDSDKLAEIAARYGFDDIDHQFDQYIHPMFHLLVRDGEINAIIKDNKENAQVQMKLYLESIGFFENKNILMVDVGWAGQIQESFDTFLKEIGCATNVYGAYMATNNVAEHRRSGGQILISTMADRNKSDFYANSLFRNVDLLETICRAPHGSVVGYSSGAPIEADGDKRALEVIDDPMLSQMQKGVISYAAVYFKMVQAFGLCSEQTMSTAKTSLMRLHRFPERNEAALHQAVGHVASHWIGDKGDLKNKISLRSQWRSTHWKEGFIRQNFGLPSLLAFSMLTALRREHVIMAVHDAKEPPLRSTPMKRISEGVMQDIEKRAAKAFTDNWLRSDIDDRQIGKPYFRDRHLVFSAFLARLHAFRNRYDLKTPTTLTMRYALKRKLSVDYPYARKMALKARHLLWSIKNVVRGKRS